MLNFSNKNILLCVTGGIAAYKAAEIIRLFKKDGGDVRVIMTESAKEFITPLTLQAVSGNEIHDSLLDLKAESAMGHIELAKWADIILIAPCTAESMAKIVHGRADDLMGAVILASKASTYIAPAMNTTMWLDQGTQANYQTLLSRGIDFIGPDEGEQACGDIGPGRLVEPDKIINLIKSHSNRGPLSGKTVTITAGPTREQIDPVRYISNNSSGKMGYALAEVAVQEGAVVNLVSGPVVLTADKSINLFKINSAREMLEAVNTCMKSSDIFISCAAVADYKPSKYSDTKIKKENLDNLEINLEKNHDILSEVAEQFSSAYIVGFAAETSDVNANAKKKLDSKNLNMIISNDVSDQNIGFNSDFNEVTIFYKNEKKEKLFAKNKSLISEEIVERVCNQLN